MGAWSGRAVRMLFSGQGVVGALAGAHHAPQAVVGEAVAAVEATDAVGAVVGGGVDPWGSRQWDAGDLEGEDVRIVSVGQLSVVYFVNRALRHLSVLDIVWLG
ncbi:hypothetical protein ACIQI8_44085 [Streptomyces sp. NPDC092369]|uniref:hypothetical protein n=1 Tax=Streptomyces sp. NPDC092369 TaxID=3366015 RepID=UPI0037F529D9